MPETRRPGSHRHPDHRRGGGKPPETSRSTSKALEAKTEVPDLSELKAEDFETLRRHPFFVDFEEGMWLYYKDNIGDGKSEEEQKADFGKLCEENVRKHSEYLLKNGELEGYKKFLEEQKGKEEVETGGSAEIKAEAKDWREVKRGVEVDVVGDLHSNYIALRENLKTLGVAQEIADGKFEWTGGNRKVILIGDILGDRWDGGNKILLAVEDLELQAKAAGGELMRVAGNHDDFEMSYLMGRETAGGGDPVQNCYKEDQGFGLLELREFGSDSLKSRDFEKEPFKYYAEAPPGSGRYEHDPIWDQMSTERRLILDNMRNSEKGKKILEAICRFKLVEFCDDNLFIHTDPTADIAQSLLALKAKGMDPRAAADYLNNYFQQNLRAVLLGGKEPDAQFDKVREIFLKTGNRANFTAASRASDYKNYHLKERHVPGPEVDAAILKYRPQWEAEEREITDALKEWGINAIIHGHSSGNFVEKFDPTLPIITADMGAFQYKKDTAVARSVVRIRTDGTIDRGTTVDLGGDKQMIEVRSR